MIRCENCGLLGELRELGYDKLNNLIFECKECGAICYKDGTLIEDEVEVEITSN